MNRKIFAIGAILVLIGLVLATSGCINQETPTVAKKQLNETEYEALIYSVASTMDNAEDTLLETHDSYLAGEITASQAQALFEQTSSTMGSQEARMNEVIPPAGYEKLHSYTVSAIQNEKKCADLCVEWVKTGDAQSEEDAEAYLMKSQEDLRNAIAEMKRLGY